MVQLALCRGIRERYPGTIRRIHNLDGDGAETKILKDFIPSKRIRS
jgi:hypothetical protein